MSDKSIFKIGGFLLLLSGALGLFYLIVSVLGAFNNALFPSYEILIKMKGLNLVRDIILIVWGLFGSLGLIFSGLMFIKLPALLVAGVKSQDVHEKLNRLQKVVFDLLHHIKRAHGQH